MQLPACYSCSCCPVRYKTLPVSPPKEKFETIWGRTLRLYRKQIFVGPIGRNRCFRRPSASRLSLVGDWHV